MVYNDGSALAAEPDKSVLFGAADPSVRAVSDSLNAHRRDYTVDDARAIAQWLQDRSSGYLYGHN